MAMESLFNSLVLKPAARAFSSAAKWLRSAAPGPWADRLPAQWRTAIVVFSVLASVVGCACAVYLCCRDSGALSTVAWIPDTVGQWADRHGRLRNLPAFFLLACPILLILREMKARIWATVAVAIFGTVLELAEYFIPRREVEWQDVAWTWAGAIAAWVLVEGAGWLITRVRWNLSCQPAASARGT